MWLHYKIIHEMFETAIIPCPHMRSYYIVGGIVHTFSCQPLHIYRRTPMHALSYLGHLLASIVTIKTHVCVPTKKLVCKVVGNLFNNGGMFRIFFMSTNLTWVESQVNSPTCMMPNLANDSLLKNTRYAMLGTLSILVICMFIARESSDG